MRHYFKFVIGLALLASSQASAQQRATLGAPVPSATLGVPQSTVRSASPDPLVGDYSPAARLGPISELRVDSGPPQRLDTPAERYNWGVPDSPAPYSPPFPTRAPGTSFNQDQSKSLFGGKIADAFDKGGNGHADLFKSDHCFDDFISPMTNPFLAEDPRSLTELRPIFMYQSIPNKNYPYMGGNIEVFSLQGRLAITERFDIVLHKLGGIVINPGSNSTQGSAVSFQEVWLSPKYTFYRDDQTGTIAAAGLMFQIPTGRQSAYQNTGGLSLVPYGTIAQRFGKTSYGTFNAMDTLGLSFATNTQRSNYLYNSLHLDFDVANWQRFYPLIELNWFHYGKGGTANNTTFEGEDLANVGAPLSGHDYLSIAIGARFKASESWQFGLATEFPLLGTKDLNNFRLTIDFIWRY